MERGEFAVLQQAGVSLDDVARWLDVSRQAVSKGLESGHYLTRRRVQVIFSRLLQERPMAAHALRLELLAMPELDLREATFDVVAVEALRDRTLDQGYEYRPKAKQELWIVAAKPRELQPDAYLERRSSELFSKKFKDFRRITPLERIAYFCPPSVGEDLAIVMQRTFEKIPVEARTDVKIVTSKAFLFTADYTICDPYQQGQQGWLMVEPGDLFVPMPQMQLGPIATAFRVAGVQCWQPDHARRRSYIDGYIDEQSRFEVLEWERDARNIPRAKKTQMPSASQDRATSDVSAMAASLWNPPILVGGSPRPSGSAAPEFALAFDSLRME